MCLHRVVHLNASIALSEQCNPSMLSGFIAAMECGSKCLGISQLILQAVLSSGAWGPVKSFLSIGLEHAYQKCLSHWD